MLEKPRSGLAGASNPRCPAKKRIRDIETKIPKCAFEGSAIHAVTNLKKVSELIAAGIEYRLWDVRV
jgi:hypothetical protein